LNAVEHEPVETRVLNLNASEATYKPKQRGYRKTKLKKFIFMFFPGDFILEPQTWYGKKCTVNKITSMKLDGTIA